MAEGLPRGFILGLKPSISPPRLEKELFERARGKAWEKILERYREKGIVG